MRNRGQIVVGGLLLLFGILLILSNVFHFDVSAVCWPTALILLGVWLLLRPRLSGAGINISPLANIRRVGQWQMSNEEFWIFVGDIRIDLSQAEIPAGETMLRAFGFVGDIRLILPSDVGLSISSTAFVNDVKIQGRKQDYFLAPFTYTSENYATAERKVHLENLFFVADLKITQI